MTNLLPTISLQAVHPTLQAAASRMSGEAFQNLSAWTRHYVLQGQYAQLTHLLEGYGVEPVPETVSQFCFGRFYFFGETLPENLPEAFGSVPQTYGDEMVDPILGRIPVDDHCRAYPLLGFFDEVRLRGELLAFGSSPYFRGDFTRLCERLSTRPGDETYRQYFNHGSAGSRLTNALGLSSSAATFSLSFVSNYSFEPPLPFLIRHFARTASQANPVGASQPGLREAFLRGYACADEGVRRAFLRMTPALCADPEVGEGIRFGGLVGVREAIQHDPSPALRELADRTLRQIRLPATT